MKNFCKDFLFFNEKDKRAILILLLLIGIATIISIYVGNFSTINPDYFRKQAQLVSDFTVYENETEDKEFFTDDINTLIEAETTDNKIQIKQKSSPKLNKGQLVNINKASFDALIKIPGIGKTLADRIIECRKQTGDFESTEQLLKIKGITKNKLSKIMPYIALNDNKNQ